MVPNRYTTGNLPITRFISEKHISFQLKPRTKNHFFLFVTLNENNWVAKNIRLFCVYYLDCLKNYWMKIVKSYCWSSSSKNCVINVGKRWTLQMLISQYLVLVLKLSLIYTVSLNTVFLNPQNQYYPGNACIKKPRFLHNL